MYKIAVLGDRTASTASPPWGWRSSPVQDKEAGARTLRQLADQGYGVIYITEGAGRRLEEEMARYRESLLPAVIPIPGVRGNTGMGIAMVKRSVEQAVGSDIIFRGE